jgi:hypothetical protein
MERARYEAELAKRRYLRVDPDNRLVAAELERDWEQKVSEYEAAKTACEQKREAETRVIDDKLKLALDKLVSDFPKIWNDPQTSNKEKKRIARLILEDVTITAEPKKTVLGIRLKGGAARVLDIPTLPPSQALYEMEQAEADEIRRLIPSGLTNSEIADFLNEKGYKFGVKGKPFDEGAVNHLARKFHLPKRRDLARSDGWLTAAEKIAELGIKKSQIHRLRKAGKIVCKKCNIPGLPYLYKPEDTVALEG